MLTPIRPGRYRMRNGGAAEVTEMGSFAYGRRETSQGFKGDFWDKENGRRIPGEFGEADQQTGEYDLVERLEQTC